MYDTLYRVGEWVQAGNPVVQMLPPQNLKVRFFVPEAAIASLAPGRTVAIHCDGCAADVPARITYVSSEADHAARDLQQRKPDQARVHDRGAPGRRRRASSIRASPSP